MMETASVVTYTPNPARIVLGAGAIGALAREADGLGVTKALIVSSPGRRAAAERAAEVLGAKSAGICDPGGVNIPEASFDVARAEIGRAGADGIVSIGGGSPIGLGKALAVDAGCAHISLPTTYSGSELMADWRVEGTEKTRGGNDPRARPAVVIYDPELTLDLPPEISGPSGMNAAAHAVESMYHPATNPVAETMGEEGLAALAVSLPAIARDPGDIAARTLAFKGAWLAGGFRAGSCLEHRMAQSLRRLHGLTHAQSHAVVLPFVVAFNEAAAPEAMARIARALGSNTAASGLFRLNDELSIPATLAEIGMPESALDEAADIIADAEIANPRPVTRDDIRAVLDDAYYGRRRI
jgi:alcohol dehydrogenase class IV